MFQWVTAQVIPQVAQNTPLVYLFQFTQYNVAGETDGGTEMYTETQYN